MDKGNSERDKNVKKTRTLNGYTLFPGDFGLSLSLDADSSETTLLHLHQSDDHSRCLHPKLGSVTLAHGTPYSPQIWKKIGDKIKLARLLENSPVQAADCNRRS